MTLRFKDGGREKVDKDNRRLRKADCARVTAKRTANLAEKEKVLFIDRRLLGVPGCAILPQRNESRGEGPFCVCRVAEDEREMFVYWIDACKRPAPVPHFHSSFSFTPFSLSLSASETTHYAILFFSHCCRDFSFGCISISFIFFSCSFSNGDQTIPPQKFHERFQSPTAKRGKRWMNELL